MNDFKFDLNILLTTISLATFIFRAQLLMRLFFNLFILLVTSFKDLLDFVSSDLTSWWITQPLYTGWNRTKMAAKKSNMRLDFVLMAPWLIYWFNDCGVSRRGTVYAKCYLQYLIYIYCLENLRYVFII